MKKILLLSTASLAMLMADFTLEGDKLTPVSETTSTVLDTTTVSNTAPTTDASNPYLEPVNIPACNANDPEVQFIKSNADWSTINSSIKRIFCVSPGNYTSLGSIKLTTSGTASKRRYIILDNGNNLHPGKLNKSQLANFSLSFEGASYWTLDRPAYFDSDATNAYEFRLASTNNIINRMFTNNIGRSVRIIDNSHNNTIQNSRLDTMTHASRTSDMTAIELVPYPVGGKYELIGTKIINNEIKNANDGFQMVSYWFTDGRELNGEGTIIDGNHIYITSDLYTDGSGNYTPSGDFAYAENAIDMKFGSLNFSNPVLITNNHFWGFRKSDSTNSTLRDNGGALIGHYGIKNTIITDNYIFDSNIGIAFGDSQGHQYSISESKIKRNVIQNCGKLPLSPFGWPLDLTSAGSLITEDNLISNGRSNHSRLAYNNSAFVFQNNLFIDTPLDWNAYSNNSQATITYHGANNNAGSYQDVTDLSQGYTNNYIFTTDKFTNNPRIITLENVLKSN